MTSDAGLLLLAEHAARSGDIDRVAAALAPNLEEPAPGEGRKKAMKRSLRIEALKMRKSGAPAPSGVPWVTGIWRTAFVANKAGTEKRRHQNRRFRLGTRLLRKDCPCRDRQGRQAETADAADAHTGARTRR